MKSLVVVNIITHYIFNWYGIFIREIFEYFDYFVSIKFNLYFILFLSLSVHRRINNGKKTLNKKSKEESRRKEGKRGKKKKEQEDDEDYLIYDDYDEFWENCFRERMNGLKV